MSNQTAAASGSNAGAGPSSSAPARTTPARPDQFKECGKEQLDKLHRILGKWNSESPCVRKDCTHEPPSRCWEQPAVYPIDTKYPSFYQPHVIRNLPESLSKSRLQWLYTCLLAKYYRLPNNLAFSGIKVYNNFISPIHKPIHNNHPEEIEFDAYTLCLLYAVGRFIDPRNIFIKRLGFLGAYPSEHHEGFDWKFEEQRDRVFRRYPNGDWREHFPTANHGETAGSLPRTWVKELTLVYSRFSNIGSGSMTEYQKAVVAAARLMPPGPSPDEELNEDEDVPQDQPPAEQEAPMIQDREEPPDPNYDVLVDQNDQDQDANDDRINNWIADQYFQPVALDDNAQVLGEDDGDQANEEIVEVKTEPDHHNSAPSSIVAEISHSPQTKHEDNKDPVGDAGNSQVKQEAPEEAEPYRYQASLENYGLKRKLEETRMKLDQQTRRHEKRQKLLHVHINDIYGKHDTLRMLQEEPNAMEDGFDHVYAALDSLKQSMADERAKVREIVASHAHEKDASSLNQELQDWVVQEETNVSEKLDALEKSLRSETISRSIDVAMEIRECHHTWITSVKPRFEREQSGV